MSGEADRLGDVIRRLKQQRDEIALKMHLARAEALKLYAVLETFQTLICLSFHVLGRDHDLDFALQPFSERFDNLHVQTFVSRVTAASILIVFKRTPRHSSLSGVALCNS